MGVIPNPKMAFIFPISFILALIFPILIKYFPKCVGQGSFPKSQLKSLHLYTGAVLGTEDIGQKKWSKCHIFQNLTLYFSYCEPGRVWLLNEIASMGQELDIKQREIMGTIPVNIQEGHHRPATNNILIMARHCTLAGILS